MVRLAIIGTGGMGNQHAERSSEIEGVKLVAGCDTDLERAKSFCDRHRIPNYYGNAAEMLDELEVDAVSVVTPDMMHAPLSLLAIEKGKHVLCEKPLAACYEDAARMRDAARKAGVINMVNFSYRNSPALQKAAELVQSGVIGVVRHVHAYYLQSWLAQDAWGHWKTTPAWLWRLSKRHGSKGVLGDIGVHILDFARGALIQSALDACELSDARDATVAVSEDGYREAGSAVAVSSQVT